MTWCGEGTRGTLTVLSGAWKSNCYSEPEYDSKACFAAGGRFV